MNTIVNTQSAIIGKDLILLWHFFMSIKIQSTLEKKGSLPVIGDSTDSLWNFLAEEARPFVTLLMLVGRRHTHRLVLQQMRWNQDTKKG